MESQGTIEGSDKGWCGLTLVIVDCVRKEYNYWHKKNKFQSSGKQCKRQRCFNHQTAKHNTSVYLCMCLCACLCVCVRVCVCTYFMR